MANGTAVLCPACGSRNKPKWEFCARCGESLASAEKQKPAPTIKGPAPTVRAAAPAKGAPKKGKFQARLSDRQTAKASPVSVVAIVVVLVIAAAIAARFGWRSLSLQQPPSQAFTMATTPAAPGAPPPTLPAGPGRGDYTEGMRLLNSGRASEAVAKLAQAVADAPDNPTYLAAHARALAESGDMDGALRQYGAAARLSPATHQREYARALERAGKSDDAIREYEGALQLQPESFELLQELGGVLTRAGKDQQAAMALSRAAAVQPGNLEVRQTLAALQEKAGNLTGAEGTYRQVLDRDPTSVTARGRLAEVLLAQGRGDEAAAVFEAGLRQGGQVSPILVRGYGSVLERAGKRVEAAAQYREYARLAPNASDAKQWADRAARLEKAAGVAPAQGGAPEPSRP
jgi:tetratricopeptide (TPR) repeat protein